MKDTKKEAKRIYEEIQGGVKEVLNGIRNFIEEGSARRLIIKNKEGEVVFNQLALESVEQLWLGPWHPWFPLLECLPCLSLIIKYLSKGSINL